VTTGTAENISFLLKVFCEQHQEYKRFEVRLCGSGDGREDSETVLYVGISGQ
jgi:hypothetical protein